MTNQKQMMEKISVLDSKLENLHSDNLSSRTAVMELLTKINDRLDQLGKNTSHSCCGEPVIIQTTPHANVVHQPILDSCSSCRDSKKEKISVSLPSVRSEGSTCFTSRERNDQVCASNLNVASIRTSSDAENVSDKNISVSRPGVVLVPDSQDELSTKPWIVANGTSSPGVTCTSGLHSMTSSVESQSKQGSLLRSVSFEPDRKVKGSVCSKLVPPDNREPSTNGDGCKLVVRQGGSLPNGTNCVVSIANHSSISTTASTTSLLTEVTSVHWADHSKTFTSPPQQLILPRSSYPASVQIIPAPSPQSPRTDHQTGSVTNSADKNEPTHNTAQERVAEIESHHQRPATVCPVSINPVVRSPVPNYYPVVMSTGPSNFLPQQTTLVVSSSGACTSSQSSSDQHSSRIPLVNVSPSSVQKNIPSGYITLSHAANVITSCHPTHHVTPAWQPQPVVATTASHSVQQGKELHVSPPAGAATAQRSGKWPAIERRPPASSDF